MQLQQAFIPIPRTIVLHRKPFRLRRSMNDQDRKAETQLPPPPETPSEITAASVSTLPPADGGGPPDELPGPESDRTLRALSSPSPSDKLSIKEMSAQELLNMFHWLKDRQAELVDPQGVFAQSRVQTVTEIAIVVDRGFERMRAAFEPRFSGIEAKISKQGEVIHALEKRCEAFERELAGMRAELDELKRDRGAEGPPAAPPA